MRIESPSHDLPRLEAVGDAVHAALIAALAIPPDDRRLLPAERLTFAFGDPIN